MRSFGLVLSLLFGVTPVAAAQHAGHGAEAPAAKERAPTKGAASVSPPVVTRTITQEGLTVEMALAPRVHTNEAVLLEEADTDVRLTLTDSATGAPRGGLFVAAWVDAREDATPTSRDVCHGKIESYIQGTLRVRPVIDLNSYFLLALNNANNITVIDPFLGFGTTKLYTAVRLRSFGEDWALEPGGGWLYVTMPRVNAVAVVRTDTWRVDSEIPVGWKPSRIRRAPDGSLWVADGGPEGAAPGVTVIDPVERRVVSRVATGAGPHDFAFSGDGRLLFVTNAGSGTVTVIDVESRQKRTELASGPRPIALTRSGPARAVYVAHAGDGAVAVLDEQTLEIRNRIPTKPGLSDVAFDPSGRWAFVVNRDADEFYVLDAAVERLRYTVGFGDAPDQVSFTENFAYVRSTGTVDVAMVPLESLDQEIAVQPFPAGELPPAKFDGSVSAEVTAAVTAADPHMADALYVPNPADKSIWYYHYMEGMPTPSGRLNNYGMEPRAVRVVGRDLRETEPGVYTTTIKAPPEGEYDLVLLVDEPRVIHCFDFAVAKDPARAKAAKPKLKVEALPDGLEWAGDSLGIRFRLRDLHEADRVVEAGDLRALVSNPLGWSFRTDARHVGGGIYEARVPAPGSGIFYLFVASEALGIRFQDHVPTNFYAPAPPGTRAGR